MFRLGNPSPSRSGAYVTYEWQIMPHLHYLPDHPVTIDSLDVLRRDQTLLVRARTSDGVEGYGHGNPRLNFTLPILRELVLPFFVGKDVRDLPTLVHDVYTHRKNYKLAGLAFWQSVAPVEFAILDALGKTVGQPVGALLGEVIRTQIPIYLSSTTRETTPHAEVERLQQRLAETGARAVKFKIGGRMSDNADAFPGRTDELVPLARQTLGDEIAIYVDANGSYDAAHAIEIGRFLQEHAIDLFEEPCPFTDYFETQQVTDALDMPVSGGEQETNLHLFRWMIEQHGVDWVQPDMSYCGGLLRALQVAEMAAAAGMPIVPHCPKANPEAVAHAPLRLGRADARPLPGVRDCRSARQSLVHPRF